MRVTIELGRPARRSVIVLLGLLLLLALPAAVLASHQFPDVPDSNQFHADIDAIAEAGITAGFDDGTYRPIDRVTRQAMAAFMHRGFGRAGMVWGSPPMAPSVTVPAFQTSGSAVSVRQLTITVPGANNPFSPQQLIHVQGTVALFANMDSATAGCPWEFRAKITDIATGGLYFQYQTFESSTGGGFYSFDVEGLFAAPPGERTYLLEVEVSFRNSTPDAAAFALADTSSLSAMTFPFGPAGTSSATPAGASNSAVDEGRPASAHRE